MVTVVTGIAKTLREILNAARFVCLAVIVQMEQPLMSMAIVCHIVDVHAMKARTRINQVISFTRATA